MRASNLTLLVLATIGVSTAAIFIVLSGFDAESIAFWRLAGTTVAFAPFALPRLRRVLGGLSPRDGLALVLAGVCYGLHFVWWPMGFERTSYESTVVLLATQPIMACLLAVPWLGEHMTGRKWISIAVATLGVGLLVAEDYSFRPEHLVGDGIVLASVLAIVVNWLVGRRLRQELDLPVYMTLIGFVATGTAVVAVGFGDAEIFTTSAGQFGWVALGLLVLVPTLFGHAAFFYLVKEVPIFYLNLVIVAEPVIAIAMKYALRDRFEVFRTTELGTLQFVGVALLLAGVGFGLTGDFRSRVRD